MRIRIATLTVTMLAALSAAPAVAQPQQTVERRVQRLEQEMRAVQRRVFQGQPPSTVEPEIQPGTRPQQPAFDPAAGNALAALTARVDALEAELARVTNLVEENGFRTRQIEEQLNQLRTETQGRLNRIEQAAAPAPTPAPARPDPAPTRPEPASPSPEPAQPPAGATDPAEAAYNAGFRLWEARQYEQAQQALTQVAQRYPSSRWASWARNLAGRAFLDDDKPASAARVFLDNYQTNPRGERAADSLYFLGQALVRLNRRSEACQVYDELAANYPDMRAFLRDRLPAARRDARCTS